MATSESDKNIEKNAQLIWNYMQLHHELRKCDAIFTLCATDLGVADRAVELYKEGYGEYLIFSGGYGKISRHQFKKPEAEVFSDRAIAAGIPKDKIIIENAASNTSENLTFTYKLLKDKGLHFQSLLLVQKPYMERRLYATFKKQWPIKGTEAYVTSQQISFSEYIKENNEDISKDTVINLMVGDLQRIIEYPKKGYQIKQIVPPRVFEAYQRLIAAGYNKHLIK